MSALWNWISANWWVAIALPLVVDVGKRWIKDNTDRKRLCEAIKVEMLAGRNIFNQLSSSIQASTEALLVYKKSPDEPLIRVEKLVKDLSSGFVVDEPYLDARAILTILPSHQSAQATIAIELWRRIRLHEIQYHSANERLLAEVSRMNPAFQTASTGCLLEEAVSRMQGELEVIARLIREYDEKATTVCMMLEGELGAAPSEQRAGD